MTTTALATYEVWYTTPHGEPMLAWQGLTRRKPGDEPRNC